MAGSVRTHLNETLNEVLRQLCFGLFFCTKILEHVCELFPEIAGLLQVSVLV